MTDSADPTGTIAFQGAPGAYSDLACRSVFPAMTTLPCAAFEDAFAAVREALERFVTLPRGVLEARERLEQLRALENGMAMSVSLIDPARLGVQVDTPADLERARALIGGQR